MTTKLPTVAMSPDRLREIEGYAAAASEDEPLQLRVTHEYVDAARSSQVIVIKDDGADFEVAQMHEGDDGTLAIARLMAAAPELLDEVRRLRVLAVEAVRVEGVVIGVDVIDGVSDTPVHTIEISTRADHGFVEGARVAVVALPATDTKEGK